ncbi:MAG: hypothetical protein MPN21_16860 [Thermoanaerobaculia bacterium]|nr:hypothetical protein [Thermoanaerobaculia bacterium]
MRLLPHLQSPPAPLLVLLTCIASLGVGAQEAAPDLRLEWQVDGRFARSAPPLRGVAGSTQTLRYRIRNIGGSDAFAAILAFYTTLGRRGRDVRIQPGPDAGRSFEQEMTLPLASGMREVCIEARLQTVADDDPRDPNPSDNRVCRRVEVHERPRHAFRGTDLPCSEIKKCKDNLDRIR